MNKWLTLSSKGAAAAALSICANSALAAPAQDSSATPVATISHEELVEIVQQQQELIESLSTAPAQASASSTTLGGYGELHLNNLSNDGPKGDKDSIDLHRVVLFIGHEFNEKIRFYSEIEWEHDIAGEGKPGETEVEQAYVEFDILSQSSIKGGVFLMPVGMINETHEPDTFYGVERNPVEKNIIPATWWEGGALFNSEVAPGVSIDAAITSGLYLDVANGKYKVRDGRQKVGKAKSDALAYTGRVAYRGVPGLELAGTLQYQTDMAQDTYTDKIPAILVEVHANYQQGPLGLKALYASWAIDDKIEAASGKAGSNEQTGFLAEASWKFIPEVGVFVRYNIWDNTAGASSDSEYNQIDFGVNYWPHPQVVVKADYQIQDAPAGKDEYEGFNLGIGYSF
ncbi:MAG: hypothetical protein KUG72_10215 [Pseudomonadales bacterium]|nr:hypothetical protein [Pseudomonadales bacterium]